MTSPYYGLFPEADQPWIPTLLDLEARKASEPDGSPIDWSRYGWSALEVPKDCIHVKARMDTLDMRFVQRYSYRMLAQETLERWQVRLQNRFDEVVNLYERAYTLYEDHAVAMQDAVPGERVSTTTDGTADTVGKNIDGGSDTDTSKVKNSDTPDTRINESDEYAGSISVSEAEHGYGRTTDSTRNDKSHTTLESERTLTGASVVESVNASIDAYRDIDTAFVREFENLFLNVFWS